MYQRHLGAFIHVEAGSEGWRRDECHDSHAVHVICNRFTMIDTEAAPAFALGGFEALEEVEEADGCGGAFFGEVGDLAQFFKSHICQHLVP